LQTKSP